VASVTYRPGYDKSDATARWTGRLTELAAAGRVPGAVLGIWADGQLTLAAAGVLSTATGVPVTTDSVFQIGSITKPWGFVLLGRIIEMLDARVWDESLRQRLVGPLGLASTVTLPEEAILHRAAVGHREHPGELDPVSAWMLARALGPAGLITASAADVLAFARVQLDGGVGGAGVRVLSADSVAAMRQPQARIPAAGHAADWVGLPWRLRQWGDRQLFGHDGSTIGQTAYLQIEPDSGVAVCLLTNAADSQTLYQALY
jgi:CubicO group peptidase (beta-lactamase class C family)